MVVGELLILWIDILRGDDEVSQLKAAFKVLLEQSVLTVSRKGAGKTLFKIRGWGHTSDLNREPSNCCQIIWNLPSTEGCETFPSQPQVQVELRPVSHVGGIMFKGSRKKYVNETQPQSRIELDSNPASLLAGCSTHGKCLILAGLFFHCSIEIILGLMRKLKLLRI